MHRCNNSAYITFIDACKINLWHGLITVMQATSSWKQESIEPRLQESSLLEIMIISSYIGWRTMDGGDRIWHWVARVLVEYLIKKVMGDILDGPHF